MPYQSLSDVANVEHDAAASAKRVLQVDTNGDPVSPGGGADPVGLKNVAATPINPATEDTLALVKAKTDNLDLATSALRDALRGGSNKTLTDVDTALASIKTAVELLDNIVSGNEAQVDVVTLPDSIDGPGAPIVDSYTTDDVNVAANTADQQLVAAPGANKQIWVYGLVGSADVAGTLSLQDSDNTALSGVMPVSATGGFVMNPSGNFAMPWIKVPTNKALEIDTVTCAFDGIITYAIVSV